MNIHDYISFNSNEEYERSILQLVQMAGDMTIKDAKQHMDQLIGRVFSKNRYLTYKYNSRSRTGNALFAFDTGFRFQHGRERIFAYTLKNTRRDEDGSKNFYGLFIQRETMLRDEIRSGKTAGT